MGEGRHEAPVPQHCPGLVHAVESAWHAAAVQAPATQVWLGVHAWPHVPQFAGSLAVFASVHAPSTQLPPLHERVMWPHTPHAARIVCPAVQAEHTPFT